MVQPSESGKALAHPAITGNVVPAERYERGLLVQYSTVGEFGRKREI